MGKRRKDEKLDSSDEDDDAVIISCTSQEVVDVDFDFFDLSPDIDYHALVNLLKQLLSHDGVLFDLGKIVDIVLAQKYIGSSVKCDGAESDPYAFATVINLTQRKNEDAIAALNAYLLEKAGSSSMSAKLEERLAVKGDTGHLGLVLSERLVNMPPQIATPLYRMLSDEIQWALEAKEPFDFSHLLFLSRIYVSSDEGDEVSSAPSHKNKKVAKQANLAETFAYHAEDEVIGKFSEATVEFTYTKSPERDVIDPFGVETRGRLMLVPADKLGAIAQEMERWMSGGT